MEFIDQMCFLFFKQSDFLHKIVGDKKLMRNSHILALQGGQKSCPDTLATP